MLHFLQNIFAFAVNFCKRKHCHFHIHLFILHKSLDLVWVPNYIWYKTKTL